MMPHAEQPVKPAVLITGGAVRLGRAIALDLAQQGFDIALHYNSSQTAAAETAELIKSYQVQCELFQHNLAQVEGLEALVQQVKIKFPHLGVLINSASSYQQTSILETTPEIFDTQMATNLRAPFFLTQAFAKVCQTGNIINIIDNKIGFNQYHYSAYLLAKKSLAEFTKMASLEFAPHIRVNGISPGVVLPAESRSPDYLEWRVQAIPLKKQGSPSHITQTIFYILENSFVTGQIFTIDGGESIATVGLNTGNFPSGNPNKE
jgi:pteridine reductase